jgi:pimeloyl-ACP methyl ester carboxylesterase
MPKITFLHGYGQNAETFQQYNAKFLSRLGKLYILEFLQGLYVSTGYKGEEGGRSWWESPDVLNDLLLKRELDTTSFGVIPPTDILFGFSQGGNVVLHSLEKNPKLCRLAIIANSLRGSVKTSITTPTVLIWGQIDPYIPEQQRQNMLEIISNPSIIIHEKGHCLPQNVAFSTQVISAIQQYIH